MALFNRVKSCSVDELDQSLLEAKGIFIDGFHEINLTLHVNKDNMYGGTCYQWTVLANRKQFAAGV